MSTSVKNKVKNCPVTIWRSKELYICEKLEHTFLLKDYSIKTIVTILRLPPLCVTEEQCKWKNCHKRDKNICPKAFYGISSHK